MKTKNIIGISAAAAGALALAPSALAADWTSDNARFWGSMGWYETGDPSATGVPQPGDNVTINVKPDFPMGFDGAWQGTTKYVNNATFNVVAGYNWLACQVYQSNTVFDVRGDFTLKSGVESTRQELFGIYNREADYEPKLAVKVGGNMSLSSLTSVEISTTTTNTALFGVSTYGGSAQPQDKSMLSFFTVAGNVALNNKAIGIATVGGQNANIGGVVSFSSAKDTFWGNVGYDDASTVEVQNISVGGLSSADGVGRIMNYLPDGSAKSSVITIADFAEKAEGAGAGGTYGGSISTAVGIVMDYGGAVQKIIGENTYTGDTVVKNGRLITSGNANSAVILQGGSFGVEGGTVKSLDMSAGGGLFFDLSGAFEITVSDAIAFDAATFLESLSFAGIKAGSFELISASEAVFADFDGATASYSDENGGAPWEAEFSSLDGKTLSVSFVPEPGTCAALFGLAAAALALGRRRRN